MSISYSIHKNHLTNGADNYRGVVHFAGTVDLEGVIERMIARGSTTTKADALAVLQDYHATIADLVLEGFKVLTPGANYGISLRGNFTGQTDGFDPSRHQTAARVNPGVQFKRTIRDRVQLQKQEATLPVPKLLAYTNLNNGDSSERLTPGGPAQLNGHRLKFDPNDPKQGIVLLTADNTVTRIETIIRHTPNELIFMVPADLAPGQYTLAVRARFGQHSLRTGLLESNLTVS